MNEHVHSDWRFISAETWDRCWSFAEQIEEQKRPWKNGNYWVYYSHFYGLIGEALLSNILDIPFNTQLKREGDGGTDFKDKLDVKTSTFCLDPHLKAFEKEIQGDKIFALVGLCLRSRKAKYFGYATSSDLRKGQLINYGQGQRYTLRTGDLTQGSPPIE